MSIRTNETSSRPAQGVLVARSWGALLLVDRNAWTKTTEVLSRISLVAGVVTAVFTATSYVVSVIRALQ